MSLLPVLTNELALQIEELIAPDARLSKDAQTSAAPITMQFGRTIAAKSLSGRPLNTVFCFGQDDLNRLDDILAFYAANHIEPYFCLAPMGFTNQVAVALTAAGFAQRDFRQVISYGTPGVSPAQLPPDVTIERVTAANLDEFAHTTAAGFEWPAQWRNEAKAGIKAQFDAEKYHFLARFQGVPVGVCSMDIRNGMANLIDGAVIPRFHRKGIHASLIHHRLYVAHTLGCSIVVAGAAFGSTSFRNQQRAGLRTAYIESGWKKQQNHTDKTNPI